MDLTNLNKDRKSRRKSSIDLSTMVYGKVPPQAKDLEEAVLGAIMLEKSAFDTVVEILKPECFYVEAHQRIYKSMQSLQQKNQPLDILTVVEELKSREELDLVGGPYYRYLPTGRIVCERILLRTRQDRHVGAGVRRLLHRPPRLPAATHASPHRRAQR